MACSCRAEAMRQSFPRPLRVPLPLPLLPLLTLSAVALHLACHPLPPLLRRALQRPPHCC